MNETIFALDIGTRNVVGLIVKKEKGKLHILAAETMEHETRTMWDGQIHDVKEVVKIVKIIKDKLEKTTRKKLSQVATAVAGRALMTMRGRASRNISLAEEITPEEVLNLELVAVDNVLAKLARSKKSKFSDFLCVDYTVVHYELDKAKIDNLVGHRGTSITVEVLATFLPRVVLDSMFAVLEKAKLKTTSLTLEPIAAIQVIVPPDMRNLNLLLLDIGAGTSDMALTDEGTVIAYGMVPLAGDEITDKICEKHLLHFPVGEEIKKSLSSKKKVQFQNVLHQTLEKESQKILDEVTPEIEHIAKKITKEIINLNGKPPQAVISVGGSSQMPRFKEKLAHELGLNPDRVATGTPKMITTISDDTGKLTGPEAVTPIGIAVTASQGRGIQFLNINVNQKRIQLMNAGRELNVLKALVAAGIDTEKLHGSNGRDLHYTLNDESNVASGGMGKPAEIKVNGKKSSLKAKVKVNDNIELIPAEDGKDAEAKIEDIVGTQAVKEVTINQVKTTIHPTILMNSHKAHYHTKVTHGAKIIAESECTLEKALTEAGFRLPKAEEKELTITVNGKERTLTQHTYRITINGGGKDLGTEIKDGDVIDYQYGQAIQYKVADVVKPPRDGEGIKVKVNNRTFIIEGAKGRILMNGREVLPDDLIRDKAKITTVDGRQSPPRLSQIFRYIPKSSIDTKGKTLKITLNAKKAGFTTSLHDGDEVKVFFE